MAYHIFHQPLFWSPQYILSRTVSKPNRESLVRSVTRNIIHAIFPPPVVFSNIPMAPVACLTENYSPWCSLPPQVNGHLSHTCAFQGLQLLLVNSFELHKYSTVRNALLQTPAVALSYRTSHSQTRPHRNTTWFWLALLYIHWNAFVSDGSVWRGAAHVAVSSQHHDVCQDLGGILRIDRVE